MLIQLVNFGPKPKRFKTVLIKSKEAESKAFYKSTISIIPGLLFFFSLVKRSYVLRVTLPYKAHVCMPPSEIPLSCIIHNLIFRQTTNTVD